MKVRGLFLLSLIAGAQAANIYGRQNTASGDDDTTDATTAVEETTAEVTATADAPTDTSTDEPIVDSSTDSPTDTPTDAGTTTTAAGDTTITRTVTVTDDNVETVSRSTTIVRTITSTVVVTSTVFETATVTSDGDVATKVVWETSTSWVNEKRDLAPQTVALEAMSVDAQPTATSVPADFVKEDFDLRFAFVKRGVLAKRATITEVVTVTDSNDSGTTVYASITKAVISTVTSQTKSTSTITETEIAGAASTSTVTSTLVVRSTRITTGVVQTTTGIPSGDYGPDETATADSGDASDSGSSSGDDGGLSTGAKAGIGAGVGVAGLLVIGGLLWFCIKRRRNEKVDHDDMFGSSEVPVGPSHGGNPTTPSMSQASPAVAAAGLSPSRNTTVGSTPEGYRGTAAGDGRAGYAKPMYPKHNNYVPVSPETNYTRTTSPNTLVSPSHDAAELASDSGATRWHQDNAAEIDGSQIHNRQGSAPPANVFEMPAQPYR